MTQQALNDIKVVELAGLGPGPFAGMMLADMGAEVVVIERKIGDKNAGLDPNRSDALFSRGKKSIAVNLKNPAGVNLLLQLIDSADILIEGFRPGVMERLGLGPEKCMQRNPKLVYCRMTGWGQYGPLAQTAGHDPNYIGISGASWYGGRKDREPTTPLTMIGDVGGTQIMLWGAMCALHHAQKTGKGQIVDAAITDGSAYASSILWGMKEHGQIDDKLGSGWADGAAQWNNTYACADGKYVVVCAFEGKFYHELLNKMGLADNPLFANQWDKNCWPEGKVVFADTFKTKTRDQWCDIFDGSDACFGPVLNFTEAKAHPHNIERQTFINVGDQTVPAPAPKLSVTAAKAGPLPTTTTAQEILQAIGFDDTAFAKLAADGII